MFKKLMVVLLIVSLCLAVTGCYTFNHQVGKGAQKGIKVEKKQWFILWGLVPIVEVKSQELAGGADDYSVQTQMSVVDVVISVITGWATIYPQTVTVTK